MADLEKKGTPAGNPAAADGKLSDEMQEKLKSLDKESNTVEYKGICGKIVAIICICFPCSRFIQAYSVPWMP